jgi:hypothetical protein
MERNKIYVEMILCKNPELIKILNIEKLLICNSLISLNNSIKKELIKNNISLDLLSVVNLNDLNFMLNIKNLQIKN